ncbi:hypothetical protein TSAR_012981 [Trichomalopsis sarcophagae]|uniref:Uncharacterized protein n=1 Tax=Trichomalopsis sarcophagae TaxID=543379 RepID=A0A232FI36_9HYME|nr:hypothetical protein TSAR_012981 [Trichomalopsis sarcophagae]
MLANCQARSAAVGSFIFILPNEVKDVLIVRHDGFSSGSKHCGLQPEVQETGPSSEDIIGVVDAEAPQLR